jgi:TonB family protein
MTAGLRVLRSIIFLTLVITAASLNAVGLNTESPPENIKQTHTNIAILDFGDSSFGRQVADTLAAALKKEIDVAVIDRDQVRAAARGGEYLGSLNLSLTEARNLGAVLGSDFFVVGDARTLRRSPSSGPIYFDSFASTFIVSARSGRLVRWDRPNFSASTAEKAEQQLLAYFSGAIARPSYLESIQRARGDERNERAVVLVDQQVPVIEAAPDDAKVAAAEGLQLPRPFRRFVPTYPQAAADADAEAVVDVLVDLDATGEVTRVEVDRWAGFGLDEVTVETARRLHFFPAMRNGIAVPLRVMLRYNFRKPPK